MRRERAWKPLRWLLWGYAAGVIGFYGALALRSRVIGESIVGDKVNVAVERTSKQEGDNPPLVSVIVPARNEERNIRACVTSLLEQDYPRYEVVVVDDASTDRTACVLDELRVTHPHGDRLSVVHVTELPAGWAGKPHALDTGVHTARGNWLLFTDADTQHNPQALRTSVQLALERGLDLLSLGTKQDLPDFWGRVLMPLAYMGISMMYPVRQVNDPNSQVAIANGQYILLRRAMYERIGGYASPVLRATVLDDRDLAREVKRAGGRIELVDGRELVHTRMYQSLREHWEGWGKNAYVGSRGGPLFFLLMVLGLPMLCIVPFALPLVGLLSHNRRAVVAGGLSTSAIVAYRSWLDHGLGVPWRYVWTHPLAGVVFTGILARSAWRSVSGRGVSWRGRIYQV